MKKLLFLILTVAVVSCASAPSEKGGTGNGISKAEAAKLFTDPESVYPEDDYLFAVGTGDTRRDAENDAMGALARIFRSDIKMSSQGVKQYRELVNSGDTTLSELEKSLVQTTTVSAEQELLGIEFSPSYTDDRGVVNILAVMDRKKTGAIYRDLIQKNNARVDSLLALADEATSLAKEFAYTNGAAVVAQGNQIYLDQLSIINPAMARFSRPENDLNTVQRRLDEVQGKMSFRIELEGDVDGVFTEVVKEELGKNKLSYSETGDLVIRGVTKMTPMDKSGKYETLQWQVSISLVDNEGTTLASFEKVNRESSLTQDQARLIAIKSIEKVLTKDFVPAIFSYFHNLILE